MEEKVQTKAELQAIRRTDIRNSIQSWGVTSHGYEVDFINGGSNLGGVGFRPSLYAIDVETDESESRGFVGLALLDLRSGSRRIYYCSDLSEDLRRVLGASQFVGHNVKFDLHCLRSWGIPIKSSQIYGDTMLMAYVKSSTEESYGLKDLAKSCLGISYPTYRDLVGTGAKKLTLDKQDIELVANYCAMDVLSTARLYEVLGGSQSSNELSYYQRLELPVYRALFDMECRGITVDVEYVKALDREFSDARDAILRSLRDSVGSEEFNPASPKQVKEILFKKVGIKEEKTDIKVLKSYANVPEIQSLLKFREVSKLASTYTGALLAIPTLPLVHTRFNQVAVDDDSDETSGIRTGRLSSSEPNLQNIPTRTEIGNKIRAAFVAPVGYKLIVADYSQIEYRLLAHFSEERRLIDAFKNGVDVHEATGAALGVDRKLGKTLNFAAIYGAQPKRIAFTAGITEDEATNFLARYWENLPGVQRWITTTYARAHIKLMVTTLYGRQISLPMMLTENAREKAKEILPKVNVDRIRKGLRPLTSEQLSRSLVAKAERQSVNYIIQGSAAEVMKMALLRLSRIGLDVRLSVHDEFVVQALDSRVDVVSRQVKQAMESVVSLRVPLVADVGVGQSWQESKGA